MRGIICYYSGSGNTKLACEYLAKNMRNVTFNMYNIVRHKIPDLNDYDIVGFATFTDFGDIPRYFYNFFEQINIYPGKNAFVLNTYGLLSGTTLKILANLAKAKQFNIISGYSLHTPESYVPMRARKMTYDNAPSVKELAKFDIYIENLDNMVGNIKAGKKIKNTGIRVGLLNNIIVKIPRAKDKKDFGIQEVDTALCKQCKTCEDNCPYSAIHLEPYPVFDHLKCNGCWKCYNHCPEKAIFTPKYKGVGHYPQPSAEMALKFQ